MLILFLKARIYRKRIKDKIIIEKKELGNYKSGIDLHTLTSQTSQSFQYKADSIWMGTL